MVRKFSQHSSYLFLDTGGMDIFDALDATVTRKKPVSLLLLSHISVDDEDVAMGDGSPPFVPGSDDASSEDG